MTISSPHGALPVDPEVLEMFAALQEPGEPDLLRELVTIFLRDAPERLYALHRAIEDGDLETAARAAHTLKGSAANLGALDLHGLAETVEHRATAGDRAAAADSAAAAETEFARVRTHLEGVLKMRPH